MSVNEPQSAEPKPERHGFQFSLRTLLLVCVVLASSLSVFGAGGIVVFALAVGLAIYLNRVKSWSSVANLALILLCLMCLIGLLMPAIESASGSGRRSRCYSNLAQIMGALYNYETANGHFPPAFVADENGKPMHSWRVLILPYLEEDSLYKAYNFSEPWDSPTNKKLLGQRPAVFACPSDPAACASGAPETSYVAVVGSNAAWAGEKPRKPGRADFPGGVSHTIMLVEVLNSGIDWTEPRDLSLDTMGTGSGKPPAVVVSSGHDRYEGFFYTYEDRGSAVVAMADGSVGYLPPGSLAAEHLRKVLQIGGCQGDDFGSYTVPGEHQRRLNWPNIAALAVWLLSVGTLLTGAVRSRKAPR
jgi:hypothetical protein